MALKTIEEFLARAYKNEKGLPTVDACFALAGQPIAVYGDGTQRRSFTWVGDVIGAMLALIEHPKAYGEVFNIGHTVEISIYDLAALDLPEMLERVIPYERERGK